MLDKNVIGAAYTAGMQRNDTLQSEHHRQDYALHLLIPNRLFITFARTLTDLP